MLLSAQLVNHSLRPLTPPKSSMRRMRRRRRPRTWRPSPAFRHPRRWAAAKRKAPWQGHSQLQAVLGETLDMSRARWKCKKVSQVLLREAAVFSADAEAAKFGFREVISLGARLQRLFTKGTPQTYASCRFRSPGSAGRGREAPGATGWVWPSVTGGIRTCDFFCASSYL